ncbi:unnamed protein product [Clonostachys rosea]|uniref:Zn(2)-C6 fungal-type domain-containing protein n=1 Tax=Bionectria ochroleuca TaxID=29856 RepID=A0ABY6TQ82_BIOOC|nr:unnamed protein product [Clonostachys rosea]
MPPRKTFTGCWTCRARRLKCDEERPECIQCQLKGITCEGYTTRLKWMRPVSVYGDLADEPPPDNQDTHWRRLLPASRMRFRGIETALSAIEKAAARSDSKTCGPFSVFAVEHRDELPESLPLVLDEGHPSTGQVEHNASAPCPSDKTFVDNQGDIDEMESTLSGDPITPGITPGLHEQLSDQSSIETPETTMAAIQPSPQTNSSIAVSSLVDMITDQEQLGGGELEGSMTTPSQLAPEPTPSLRCFGNDPSAEVFLKARVRHLLRNYAENVLPIFSPLDQTDVLGSPWRNFHLSRALQCSIELEILGSAPPSRRALLQTILTISAYNLRNLHLSDGEVSQTWGHVASKYKCEALKQLETCVGESYADLTDSVYNELLAAMLCMVTIDVISGDTSTSQIHLGASETLIRARIARCGISDCGITKGLYVIFLYLRTMQEATMLLTDGPQRSIRTGSTVIKRAESREDIAELMLSQQPGKEFEPHSIEIIYGIPRSLLFLLRKATRLLRTIDQHEPSSQRNSISPSPHSDIGFLEDEILEWPVEEVVARMDTAPVSEENRLVMQHYTRALHQAVIIFYSRKAQNVHRRHVQPYVQEVIRHLEKIEEVKERYGLRTGNIPWPAFIAGSQAMGQSTQDRFARWFDNVSSEGIWTYNKCKDALVDIWAQESTPVGFSALGGLNLVLT